LSSRCGLFSPWTRPSAPRLRQQPSIFPQTDSCIIIASWEIRTRCETSRSDFVLPFSKPRRKAISFSLLPCTFLYIFCLLFSYLSPLAWKGQGSCVFAIQPRASLCWWRLGGGPPCRTGKMVAVRGRLGARTRGSLEGEVVVHTANSAPLVCTFLFTSRRIRFGHVCKIAVNVYASLIALSFCNFSFSEESLLALKHVLIIGLLQSEGQLPYRLLQHRHSIREINVGALPHACVRVSCSAHAVHPAALVRRRDGTTVGDYRCIDQG
jgi:hypothetical protein